MSENIEIEIDLPSNSKQESTEREKLNPVVVGEVVAEKPGVGSLARKIFSGERMKTVLSFIGVSVILPSVKSMVFDSITKGAERALYGEDSPLYQQANRSAGPIQYNMISSPYGRGRQPGLRALSPSKEHETGRQTEVWVIPTRGEAELVIDTLKSNIRQYGRATVADYYELIGKTGVYTDNNWGWQNLNGVRLERSQGGYVINFPNAIPV